MEHEMQAQHDLAEQNEAAAPQCQHEGRLYKGSHETFHGGWMCGKCGGFVKELPRNYAVVFMAFPLLRD